MRSKSRFTDEIRPHGYSVLPNDPAIDLAYEAQLDFDDVKDRQPSLLTRNARAPFPPCLLCMLCLGPTLFTRGAVSFARAARFTQAPQYVQSAHSVHDAGLYRRTSPARGRALRDGTRPAHCAPKSDSLDSLGAAPTFG